MDIRNPGGDATDTDSDKVTTNGTSNDGDARSDR